MKPLNQKQQHTHKLSFRKTTLLLGACLLASLVSISANAKQTTKQIRLSSDLATPVLSAGKSQNAYIRVALNGFELNNDEIRTPLNVAIVLDQSSSMAGQKIKQAKQAAKMAVNQLDEGDIVSIITYDSTVNVLVSATNASNKNALFNAINRIKARGNTALFAGTSKGGYEVRNFLSEKRVNRVVLLSDGMANVGPSSPYQLGQLGQALAKDGISVSTIGLGLGYNEDLMTQLANYSDGSHSFVENAADLARIFEQEFGQAKSVVAQDIDIKIILKDGITPIRIVGRDGDIIGNTIVTRINQIYSKQESYVVIEVNIPASQAGTSKNIANVEVNYNNMVANKRFELEDSITASFSESKEEVKEAVNTKVYVSAVKQLANEQRKEAVILRDQGKKDEAKAKLKQSSILLGRSAEYISSDKLRQESLDVQAEADAVAAPSAAEWNKNRKALRAKSYQIEKQQIDKKQRK